MEIDAAGIAPRAAGTPAGDRLEKAVDRILGRTMGTMVLGPRGPARPMKFYLFAWFLLYAPLWLLAAQVGERDPRLTGLLAWGFLYFAAALVFSRRTSDEIRRTIQADILPYVSPAYADAVAEDLQRRYPASVRFGLPVLIAALSLAAAIWALAHDLLLPGPSHLVGAAGAPPAALEHQLRRVGGEHLLWAATHFLYFLTAAQSVIAARFYLAFARNLERESEDFSLVGAADSPVVRGLSRLATQVLVFWAMIFLSILAVMLVAALPEAYRLPPNSKLLFTMVPIAGFFSLGFGTLVYLAGEARIRTTLQRFASRRVAPLQQRTNALMRADAPAAEQLEEVQLLSALQDRIVAGARYGSRVGVSVSVALPLIMPVVSIAVSLLTKG
ncbi:MAG TPA: hypothetical protein VF577_03885 [Allosphingosinicella sp.]|jgi:hypothetical protein